MADAQGKLSGGRRQPSRLQRRAPASIKISPSRDWNVAIPLLSPLVSPTSPSRTAENRPGKDESKREHHHQVAEPGKPVAYKKWQHPAAPFCYEPATFVPFLCSGMVDRS